MPSAAAKILAHPGWLAHRYDPEVDAVQYVWASREARAAAPFLTDAELKPAAPLVLKRHDALAAIAPAAPIHFIVHSAYCCSTLLSRALDRPGLATTLKEPQILNDLVGWRHRKAPAQQVAAVLDATLQLLAQPFEPAEAVIVKPSNVTNGLAAAMLGLRPAAKAVLLYAPLPAYLASIARKGMDGRLWVRELFGKQLMDGLIDLGFAPRDYLLLTDLQVAAVGWLAQQALFIGMAQTQPERVRMLSSEVLVAEPRATLERVIRLFGLNAGEVDLDGVVAEAFSRDAKSGSVFGNDQRSTDQRAGKALHADELEKVVIWTEAVATDTGVAIVPPRTAELR